MKVVIDANLSEMGGLLQKYGNVTLLTNNIPINEPKKRAYTRRTLVSRKRSIRLWTAKQDKILKSAFNRSGKGSSFAKVCKRIATKVHRTPNSVYLRARLLKLQPN